MIERGHNASPIKAEFAEPHRDPVPRLAFYDAEPWALTNTIRETSDAIGHWLIGRIFRFAWAFDGDSLFLGVA